jgi:nucleoside-diphosphate-sugar epimerase
VIHLAATTNAEQSFYDPDAIEANNLGATKAVGLWANSRGKNLIHLSSTSVYGHSGSLVAEDEPDQCNPQSPYAVVKLREEQFLKEQLGNNFLSLRFGTIYGISPGMRFHTAVNKFCFQAAFDIPLEIWRTSLDQVRPYLHLDDASNFVEHVLRNNIFTGETYNVLSGNHCVKEILDEIRNYKPDITTKIVDSPIMNQLSYEVSLDKAARLGWRPRQTGLDLSPYFETLFLSTTVQT